MVLRTEKLASDEHATETTTTTSTLSSSSSSHENHQRPPIDREIPLSSSSQAAVPIPQKGLPPRVPLPTTISLYNVWNYRVDPNKWYRPQHATDVIPTIHLELVLDQETVYRAHQTSLSPSFQFINENISHETIDYDSYRTLTARFTTDVLQFEVNLHPHKLCKMAQLPDLLPLNFIVIEYSDSILRIPPIHYNLLCENSRLQGMVSTACDDADDSERAFDNVSVLDSPVTSLLSSQKMAKEFSMKQSTTQDIPVSHPLWEQALLENLQGENKVLEDMIQRETYLLEKEMAQLELGKEFIQQCRIQTIEADSCTKQIDAALEELSLEIQSTEFSLQAQQIRLIGLVMNVYPVSVSNRVYTIRGLELSSNILLGTDEVIAGALGYLVHAVFLISKYLHIHLRYKLHCQNSKSAISNEQQQIFPLFRDRKMHEQFQYGYYLLNSNVETICRQLHVETTNLHILAKLQRIYESVVDGY